MGPSFYNPASCPWGWTNPRCVYTTSQSSPKTEPDVHGSNLLDNACVADFFSFSLSLSSPSNPILCSGGPNLRLRGYISLNLFISLCFPDANKSLWVNRSCAEDIRNHTLGCEGGLRNHCKGQWFCLAKTQWPPSDFFQTYLLLFRDTEVSGSSSQIRSQFPNSISHHFCWQKQLHFAGIQWYLLIS